MVANAAPYTSKIIRAGALLPDTKLLLAHWNLSDDVEANLRRIRQENLFGKASRSRVAEILAIFKQRYLGPRGAQRDRLWSSTRLLEPKRSGRVYTFV